MPKTVDDFRTRIRAIIDLDASDLPDAMLDEFILQGARYAQRWNQAQWPFYHTSWTHTWPADTATQTLVQIQGSSDDVVDSVRYVRSDDVRLFKYLSESDFHRLIDRDNTSSGVPSVWSPSLSGTEMTVWPAPSVATEIVVYGFKSPSNWVSEGAGGVSDMPEEFDDAILAYALGKTYASQDEGQTSVFWLNMADVHLTQLEDRYDSGPPVDLVMNGGAVSSWMPETPGRLRFDFEVGF